MEEEKFARGIWFNDPHEKAPDYVLGSISINRIDFMSWLQGLQSSDGKIRLSVKRGKSGKVYMEVDTYKKDGQSSGKGYSGGNQGFQQSYQQGYQQGYQQPQQSNGAMAYLNQQEQNLRQPQQQMPNFDTAAFIDNGKAPWEK